MGSVIVDESSLHGIGDAIRERGNVTRTFIPGEMPDAIRSMVFDERAVLVGYAEKTINLADDTTFDSITPNNTTSQTIRAAQTNELEVSFDAIDLDAYDLFTVAATEFEPVYKEGNILPRLIKQLSVNVTKGFRYLRPNAYPAAIDSAMPAYLSSPDTTTASYVYRGTNGAVAWTASLSNNSIIAASSRPTVWTSATPSGGEAANQNNWYALAVKWSPSSISVRGSTSSFSADAMKDLDSRACEIVRKLYVYCVPKEDQTAAQKAIAQLVMFENLDN